MKRGFLGLPVIMLMLAMGTQAFAASVERYVVLWPASPNVSTTGILTDSTAALCGSTAGNWADLTKAPWVCGKVMIGATWTKSADIDTVDFILRATDGFKTTIVNIDTDLGKVASSAYQQMYAAADSADLAGMKYIQLLGRMGVIDNTDAVRTQYFDVQVSTFTGLGEVINRTAYTRHLKAIINE